MRILDSHEFIELYRGDKDVRLGMEMVRQRSDVEFISLACARPSPNDASVFGISATADGPLPVLPERFELRLVPGVAGRFARTEAGGIAAFMPGFGSAVKAARPDVVMENPFTWLTPRSYQTYWATKQLRIPRVYYDPGDEIPVNRKQAALVPFERPVVTSADHIITYNAAGRRRFVTKYGCDPSSISVIPKPIDVSRCGYTGPISDLRRELTGGHPDALLVGYVGRLTEKRSRVLRAVAEQCAVHPELGDARFAFVGGALSSNERESDYRASNSYVTGMVPNSDVPRYLAALDVVVFPDITSPGAFHTSVAEAMAAGTAMIVGCDSSDFVPLVDGKTARIVTPRSVQEIVAVLAELARDRDAAARMGENVRAFARENMDYSVVAKAYLDILEGVAHG